MSTYGLGIYGSAVYGGSVIALVGVSPSFRVAGSGAGTLTFSGALTTWLTTAPTITVSAGTLGAVTVVTNTSATASYTPPATPQTITFTDTTDGNSMVSLVVAALPAGQPTLVCQLSLTDPTVGPNWVDISAYLKSFRTSRGRSFELDQPQAGTATVVLDNTDGRFNSLNTSGPYYGSLRRWRRMRLLALWSGGTYPIFSGFISQLPQQINGPYDAEVAIPLVDGFGALSQASLNSTYAIEKTDVRIGHVLDNALWTTGSAWHLADSTSGILGSTTVLGPVGDRQLLPGSSVVDAITLNNTTALQHVQDVQATEQGWMFISAGGAFTFYGRARRVAQVRRSTSALFGDRPTSGGELLYVNAEINDDIPIYNTVTVSRPGTGSVDQTAMDATSRTRYFIQSPSTISSMLTDDPESLALATYYVNRFKDPSPRIATLHLDPSGDPSSLYPQVLGQEIANAVTVRVRPPGSTLIEQPSWIEGIEHTWTAEGGEWQTAWHLTPIDQTTNSWVLGSSTLGTDTVLGIY